MPYQILGILSVGLASVLALGCSSSEGAGETTLVAECVDDARLLKSDDWLCDEELTVECEDGGAPPEVIYFEPSGDPPAGCEDLDLSLNDDGPFGVDTHDVEIKATRGEGGELVETCTSKLKVVDTLPPYGDDEPIELWPPNHKFHTISGADCGIRDQCDGDNVKVRFHKVSSDEPVNARGDGNTDPDIILTCDGVKLRAERQGGSDGRVYKLHWYAEDNAGHEAEGTPCVVTVPHDQSGREAINSTDTGEKPPYVVTLDEDQCDDGTGGSGGHGGAGGEGGEGGTGGGDGGSILMR